MLILTRLEGRREAGACDLDKRLKVKLKTRKKKINQPKSELQRRNQRPESRRMRGQGEGKKVFS